MSNQKTFLSRVFGVNSTFPGDETELSTVRNNQYFSDDESRIFLQRQKDRSMLQSDDEVSDSGDEIQENIRENWNSVALKQNDNEVDTNVEDVPLSIMVHPVPEKVEENSGPPVIGLLNKEGSKSPQEHILFNKSPSSKSKSPPSSNNSDVERIRRTKLGILNPKERALWKWANVENLDKFLQDVYSYYLGSGYYCIMLKKIFDLATLVFIVYFTTYLSSCIDYSKLKSPKTKRLSDITVDKCYSKISGTGKFCLWLFFIYFTLKVIQLYFDAKELSEIHNFYNNLLEISDNDIQTVSWQIIVKRLVQLKDQNAITSHVIQQKLDHKIDAHHIANRIMRKENYYIALFNKDILDLTLPIPMFGKNFLTRTLEWNLQLCISGFVFNENGQIRQNILKESKRREMSEDLSKRFMLAGILNIIISPVLVIYFILLYFFRYFNEYRKNPGLIGSRQYTPLAEWKFREFNELYHIFQRRLNLSVPKAAKYVDQFPKETTNIFCKFIALVSGSFAAVLGILSIVDPDMFFNFEITKDRTVLFYISLFGTIWALSHGSIPEEYQVYDSESSLLEVAEYTHYLPQSWEGKYHSDEVRGEFCELFSLKALTLFREVGSFIITPFILWFLLPKSSEKIVDFFREYSVHIDGLGYVCLYAMFDVDKTTSKRKKSSEKYKTPHYNSGEEKMMKSYMYFLDSYGDGNHETQRNGGTLPIKPTPPKPQTSLNHSILGRYSSARKLDHSIVDSQDRIPNYVMDNPKHLGDGNDLRDWFSHDNVNREKKSNTSNVNDNLAGSFITALPKTDIDEYENTKEPGVLGLVNQFYKDYHISN